MNPKPFFFVLDSDIFQILLYFSEFCLTNLPNKGKTCFTAIQNKNSKNILFLSVVTAGFLLNHNFCIDGIIKS
jgi:hypothetical protein